MPRTRLASARHTRKTVEFGYDEQKASRRVQSLTEFLDEILAAGQRESLDEAFLDEVRKLYTRLKMLLEE